MKFQAHKGVSTEYPENTLPACIAAIDQGYDAIELDVSVTRDMQFVLLHDNTLNRTGRLKDGSIIPDTIKIGDITYQGALDYDFGIGFSTAFAGTPLPLLSDVLALAQKHQIPLKIDNKYERFTDAQKNALFELLKPCETIACLTCASMNELKRAAAIFPRMHFHYDGPVNPDSMAELGKLLPRERLTVWLPHQNPATSWVKVAFADADLSRMVRQYAELGIWILSEPDHLRDAIALNADIVETNGQLKPIRK